MNSSRALLLLSLAAVVGAASAADGASAVFVNKAAQGGMTEVALGKLALTKSQDPVVKKFAERMVTDHGKANAELTALASAKGIEVPTKLDATHEAMLESMETQDGAAFDRAYSEHMNLDHSKAISLFENATMSEDRDVAGFAKKTLPTLKEHKALAEKLATKPKE